MKKLIEKVFGVELHANAQNINGKKSSGCEDYAGYSNWKALGSFTDSTGTLRGAEY